MDDTLEDDLENTFSGRFPPRISPRTAVQRGRRQHVRVDHDDYLTLDDLKILSGQAVIGAPVELLTLSACQTAPVTTGCAYWQVAIKCGARAALAIGP